MTASRDWHLWHHQYDDPTSSLSRRLDVVRDQLDKLLTRLHTPGRVEVTRLVSLCAGDGRDVLPTLARHHQQPVRALLVELDQPLTAAARLSAIDLGLDNVLVRTADAGDTTSFADFCPADVLMLCGVFGNISDDDVQRTIKHLPRLLAPGASVIWTRGRRAGQADPSAAGDDPSRWVRELFQSAGFDETAFVRPSDAGFRVGVNRLASPPSPYEAANLFSFVGAP